MPLCKISSLFYIKPCSLSTQEEKSATFPFLPPVTAFRIRYSSNMGLLDLLWDDTVAGPQPDNGLSKLRKYRTLSCSARSLDFSDDIHVTRSITILKTSHFRNVSGDTGSLSSSPAGSTAPDSPVTRVHSIFPLFPWILLSLSSFVCNGIFLSVAATTPRGCLKGIRRKSEPFEKAEPRSPTVYDWSVKFTSLRNLDFVFLLSEETRIFIR